jgi:hypothetical protein
MTTNDIGFTEEVEWAAMRIGQPLQIGSFVWKVKTRKEFTVTTDAQVREDSSVSGNFATCTCSIGRKAREGRIVYCPHVMRVWLEILEQPTEELGFPDE